jgi:hypothetical protein
MKKIKPLEEGKTKSQIKTYEGEIPMTQAPPPPKPLSRHSDKMFGDPKLARTKESKVCGEWQVNNKRKQIIFPLENSKSNNMEKRLGKIESVRFGHGGYQDACIGISVTLGNGSWGVGDFKGAWDPEMIKRSEYTQWTEEDRTKSIDDTIRFVSKLLKDAKVDSIDKLKNIPVEVTFEGMSLKEWRILTEVL